MALTLCTMCERHVRVTETHCPFCRAVVVPRVSSEGRAPVTRAVAFAAIALAVSCEEKKEPPPATPVSTEAPTTKAAPSSSVAPVASVTASAPDATSVDAPEDAPTIVPPKPTATVWKKPPPLPPNVGMPYGGPPADGLFV